MNNGLIELPMSTVKFFNKSLPFGGGGYFRLFPFFLTKAFLKSSNSQNRPMNFYLHPYEIGKEVVYIDEIPLLRKFRTYYGVSGVESKINKLIKEASFGRADQFITDNNI